jgi:hypothetical protein
MKTVFLDIDGVLNSDFWDVAHQFEISNGELIDEQNVIILSEIIKQTNAVIIMHSGWRFWLNEELQSTCKEASNLLALLKKYNISIYDKTPDFSTDEIRKTKNSV